MPRLTDLIDEDAASVVENVDLAPLDGSSILITGASGLLGLYFLSSLRRRMRLSRRKIDIVVVMRSAPPAYLAPLFDAPEIRLCLGDLSEPEFVRSLPATQNVIHAAGYGQPAKFLEKPLKTIELNTTATASLLEKMPAGGKFLFVSSSEIYSGSPRVPSREDDIGSTGPDHPRACYIEGKRCGEAICHCFRAKGGAVRIARLALAYGPGTRPDDQRVLNALIRRALIERKIALLDQGTAQRTYGYVTDTIVQMLSILLHGREAVYNVGGCSAVSILQLAHAIGDIVGVPVSTPTETREMAGAPSDVSLDLSRVCREFGKDKFVPFDEGLKRTIEWQRELYKLAADAAG